jgi:hypothetical protein
MYRGVSNFNGSFMAGKAAAKGMLLYGGKLRFEQLYGLVKVGSLTLKSVRNV